MASLDTVQDGHSTGLASLHQHDCEILALLIPMGILCTTSVALRFFVRSKNKIKLDGDDWFCLAAFAVWTAYWGFELRGIGFYKASVFTLPNPYVVRWLKGAYVSPILSIICATLARVSILWLYYRLFTVRRFRVYVWIVGAYSVAWGVATLFTAIFKCTPIRAAWDITSRQNCVDMLLFSMVEEPFNMLSDLLIVLIPIRVIAFLQLPLKRKIILCGVFALGLFVTMISILRLAYTSSDAEKLMGPESARWLLTQVTMSVVVISLPTYGPVVASVEAGMQYLIKRCSTQWTKKRLSLGISEHVLVERSSMELPTVQDVKQKRADVALAETYASETQMPNPKGEV